MKLTDKNDKQLKDGDIIDIHQTVNGCNLFIVNIDSEGNYSVKYYMSGRDYEYDTKELLECSEMFSDEKTIEVVGNLKDGGVYAKL